jgi:hypothetical protein
MESFNCFFRINRVFRSLLGEDAARRETGSSVWLAGLSGSSGGASDPTNKTNQIDQIDQTNRLAPVVLVSPSYRFNIHLSSLSN